MGRVLLEPQANAPAEANPKNRTGFNDTYFDTNMVIILAALLCALICALSLNSALRCVLRITSRFTSEQDAAASNANANANANAISGRLTASTGLKKRALKQIPVGLYGSGIINMKATECLICLGDFVEGEKVRVLPKCNHGFHVRCIDTWLLSRDSCPTCRQSLALGQPSLTGGSSGRDDDVAVSVVGT